MPDLDPLPPITVARIRLLRVPMTLATPWRTARGAQTTREVLLVHVIGADSEGWAECPVETTAGYSPETTATATAALRDRLVPAALRRRGSLDAVSLRSELDDGRTPMALAALELAVLDAQLRRADRSLADWLGATAMSVAPGAALGLHDDVDDLLAEADDALRAGAARLRLKIAPGHAHVPLRALREHVGADVLLQADANGSFEEADAELDHLDDLGLACLEQPLAPGDLPGHARLAARLDTPICLDEPLTSLAAVEASVAAGACEMVCLKPARVGWHAARAVHDRCAELGVPVWVGGMLDSALGRAANLAVAALPHLALPPDLDPRGRFHPDLADPRLPVEGAVMVPTGPGTDAVPDPTALRSAEVVGAWSP